jgi:hypothetical protein
LSDLPAKVVQIRLNQISVGIVFTVDDQINIILEIKANMYSHQICLSNSRPGIIIIAFATKAKNSTVFGLFQYFLYFIVLRA